MEKSNESTPTVTQADLLELFSLEELVDLCPQIPKGMAETLRAAEDKPKKQKPKKRPKPKATTKRKVSKYVSLLPKGGISEVLKKLDAAKQTEVIKNNTLVTVIPSSNVSQTSNEQTNQAKPTEPKVEVKEINNCVPLLLGNPNFPNPAQVNQTPFTQLRALLTGPPSPKIPQVKKAEPQKQTKSVKEKTAQKRQPVCVKPKKATVLLDSSDVKKTNTNSPRKKAKLTASVNPDDIKQSGQLVAGQFQPNIGLASGGNAGVNTAPKPSQEVPEVPAEGLPACILFGKPDQCFPLVIQPHVLETLLSGVPESSNNEHPLILLNDYDGQGHMALLQAVEPSITSSSIVSAASVANTMASPEKVLGTPSTELQKGKTSDADMKHKRGNKQRSKVQRVRKQTAEANLPTGLDSVTVTNAPLAASDIPPIELSESASSGVRGERKQSTGEHLKVSEVRKQTVEANWLTDVNSVALAVAALAAFDIPPTESADPANSGVHGERKKSTKHRKVPEVRKQTVEANLPTDSDSVTVANVALAASDIPPTESADPASSGVREERKKSSGKNRKVPKVRKRRKKLRDGDGTDRKRRKEEFLDVFEEDHILDAAKKWSPFIQRTIDKKHAAKKGSLQSEGAGETENSSVVDEADASQVSVDKWKPLFFTPDTLVQVPGINDGDYRKMPRPHVYRDYSGDYHVEFGIQCDGTESEEENSHGAGGEQTPKESMSKMYKDSVSLIESTLRRLAKSKSPNEAYCKLLNLILQRKVVFTAPQGESLTSSIGDVANTESATNSVEGAVSILCSEDTDLGLFSVPLNNGETISSVFENVLVEDTTSAFDSEMRDLDSNADVSDKQAVDSDADATVKQAVDSGADVTDKQAVGSDADVIDKQCADSDADVHDMQAVDSDPDVTDKQAVDSDPDVTDKQAVDSDPDATDKQAVDSDPDVTDKQAVDSDPDVTDKQGVDSDPDVTDKQAVDSDADVTVKQAVDSDPDVTDKQAVDSDPDVTDKQAVDSDPDVTDRQTTESGADVTDKQVVGSDADVTNAQGADFDTDVPDKQFLNSDAVVINKQGVDSSEKEASDDSPSSNVAESTLEMDDPSSRTHPAVVMAQTGAVNTIVNSEEPGVEIDYTSSRRHAADSVADEETSNVDVALGEEEGFEMEEITLSTSGDEETEDWNVAIIGGEGELDIDSTVLSLSEKEQGYGNVEIISEENEEKVESCSLTAIWNDCIEEPEVYEQERTHSFGNIMLKERFGCVSCGFAAYTPAEIKTHWIANHLRSDPYCCPHCEKTFSSSYLVTLHVQTFHEGKAMRYRIETGSSYLHNVVVDYDTQVPVVEELSVTDRLKYEKEYLSMFGLQDHGVTTWSLFSDLIESKLKGGTDDTNSPEEESSDHEQEDEFLIPPWHSWLMSLSVEYKSRLIQNAIDDTDDSSDEEAQSDHPNVKITLRNLLEVNEKTLAKTLPSASAEPPDALKTFSCVQCTTVVQGWKTFLRHLKTEHGRFRHLREGSKDLMRGSVHYVCTACPFRCISRSGIMRHVKLRHLERAGYCCPYCRFQCTDKVSVYGHVWKHHPKSKAWVMTDPFLLFQLKELAKNFIVKVDRFGKGSRIPKAFFNRHYVGVLNQQRARRTSYLVPYSQMERIMGGANKASSPQPVRRPSDENQRMLSSPIDREIPIRRPESKANQASSPQPVRRFLNENQRMLSSPIDREIPVRRPESKANRMVPAYGTSKWPFTNYSKQLANVKRLRAAAPVRRKRKHRRRLLEDAKSWRPSGVTVSKRDEQSQKADIVTDSGEVKVNYRGYGGRKCASDSATKVRVSSEKTGSERRGRRVRVPVNYRALSEGLPADNLGSETDSSPETDEVQQKNFCHIIEEVIVVPKELEHHDYCKTMRVLNPVVQGQIDNEKRRMRMLRAKMSSLKAKYPQLKLKPVVVLEDVMQTILKSS